MSSCADSALIAVGCKDVVEARHWMGRCRELIDEAMLAAERYLLERGVDDAG